MAISIKSIPVLTGKLLQMIPHEIVVAKIESITNKAIRCYANAGYIKN